jgi:hypothetical protein
MNWCANLNIEEINCLVIEFVDLKYSINQHCIITNEVKLILKLDFRVV